MIPGIINKSLKDNWRFFKFYIPKTTKYLINHNDYTNIKIAMYRLIGSIYDQIKELYDEYGYNISSGFSVDKFTHEDSSECYGISYYIGKLLEKQKKIRIN